MSEELSDRDLASDLYRDARLMDECGYLHIGTVMRRAAKRLENHHIPRAQYEAYDMAAKLIVGMLDWMDSDENWQPFKEAAAALRAAGCLEDGE